MLELFYFQKKYYFCIKIVHTVNTRQCGLLIPSSKHQTVYYKVDPY